MTQIIATSVVMVAVVIASITDIRRFKVYNLLNFPLMLSGIAFHCLVCQWDGLIHSVSGLALGFGILVLPYLMGGLGAGDVKFVMAIGAWIGPLLILASILVGSVAIMAYYYFLIASRQGVEVLSQSASAMVFRLMCFGRNLAMDDQFESVSAAARNPDSQNRGRLIPFSAMMSIGIICVLVISWLVGTGIARSVIGI